MLKIVINYKMKIMKKIMILMDMFLYTSHVFGRIGINLKTTCPLIIPKIISTNLKMKYQGTLWSLMVIR
ncbi:hypothetical protein EG347_11665 [Chryseobacterium sp. G0186]|nr:hypothetical protein EG347_11665 [Chryseobacterium sp. G0186]